MVSTPERMGPEERVATVSGVLHLVLVVILLLMVVGPSTAWLVAD